MSLFDKRIPDLVLKTLLPTNGLFPWYDPATDTTYRIPASALLGADLADPGAAWNEEGEYDEGDIVSYNGEVWISTGDANEGNPPGPESAFWDIHEPTPVEPTTFGGYWTARVYNQADAFVVYVLDSKLQLFKLNVAAPFNSTNLINEYAAGSWLLVGERGYKPVTVAAHGWSVGDWLTIKAGAWAKCDLADVGLARITNVVDADTIVVALKTNLISVSGATAFTTYYHTAAGAITDTVNDNPAFVAISATEAIIYPGSGGSGGGGGSSAWGGITGTVTDQADLVAYVAGETNKFTVVTANISGAVVLDLSAGSYFILTLTGDVTSFDFDNEVIGKQYLFKFKKDTTEKAFTWTAGRYRFPFGNAPTLTNPTTNGSSGTTSEDIISAICSSADRLDIVSTPNLMEN